VRAELMEVKWQHMEQTSKSSIQEKKIRVLFLSADDATSTSNSNSTPARTTGTSRDSMLPSPSPETFTPQRGVAGAVGPVSIPGDRPSGSKNLGEIENETFNPAVSTMSVGETFSAAATKVSNAIPVSQEDLSAQLAEAKATITRLTNQATEATGLRQRKTESTRDSKSQLSTAADNRAAPAGGVSVQITALLCLLSFLVAYFLF
jgi:hypothetical protein